MSYLNSMIGGQKDPDIALKNYNLINEYRKESAKEIAQEPDALQSAQEWVFESIYGISSKENLDPINIAQNWAKDSIFGKGNSDILNPMGAALQLGGGSAEAYTSDTENYIDKILFGNKDNTENPKNNPEEISRNHSSSGAGNPNSPYWSGGK